MLTRLYRAWRRQRKARQTIILQEVSRRLVERLRFIKLQPQLIVNISLNTSYLAELLVKQYSNARIINVEQDPDLLNNANKLSIHDAELGIEPQSIDLIIANLSTLWCQDLQAMLLGLQRILKPGGLLMFTCLGPDTLKELKSYSRIPNLTDMHDIGDLLLATGWQDPVMEMEMLVVNYRRETGLCKELAALKLAKPNASQLDEMPLSVTFEIIYGHAWQTAFSKQVSQAEIKIPVAQIKRPHKKAAE